MLGLCLGPIQAPPPPIPEQTWNTAQTIRILPDCPRKKKTELLPLVGDLVLVSEELLRVPISCEATHFPRAKYHCVASRAFPAFFRKSDGLKNNLVVFEEGNVLHDLPVIFPLIVSGLLENRARNELLFVSWRRSVVIRSPPQSQRLQPNFANDNHDGLLSYRL